MRHARVAEPSLGQGHLGFLLAAMREPRHRLADGDDLSGLRERRGDDAVGIGAKLGIGELVAGELECAARALEPALGFVACRLLARGTARARGSRDGRCAPGMGECGCAHSLGLGAPRVRTAGARVAGRVAAGPQTDRGVAPVARRDRKSVV